MKSSGMKIDTGWTSRSDAMVSFFLSIMKNIDEKLVKTLRGVVSEQWDTIIIKVPDPTANNPAATVDSGSCTYDLPSYTCAKCMREHLSDNTKCNACGQDFCMACGTWWNDNSGSDYCYSCRD